jgi:MFS family permease
VENKAGSPRLDRHARTATTESPPLNRYEQGPAVSNWFRQATGDLPRQFWFLWTGTLINRIGAFVVIFLAIYLTGERHFSQSQAGLVIGLYGIGGALGTTGGGVLSDRWGRRPTMLVAQFGAASLMLTLGFAHAYGLILAITLLLGVFTEAARPAFAAMMVDIVPNRDRARAFSLSYWAVNLGFALSALGAGLAAKVDYLLLFVIDAGTTVITALISLIFLVETRPDRPAAGRARPPDGSGTVLRDRVFLGYLLVSFGGIFVIMQFQSTLPIAMTARGLSAATFGGVIAVNGVLIVLGQLFVPRLIDGYDRSRVLALAALIVGVGYGLTAFAGPPWSFALTVVIWTLGEMLQAPSNATMVAALSPASLRGRYQGLNSLTWSVGAALAPVAGGFTQQHLGDAVLWIGCFVVCTLVAVGHLIAGPGRERRIAQLNPAVDAVVPVLPANGEPLIWAPAAAGDAHPHRRRPH